MALAAIVEDINSLPEATRAFYKQVDDKFVLDADIESHPQVQGLRNAYKSDHERVKKLNDDLARFKDVDPDRWVTLKDLNDDQIREFEKWKLEEARKNVHVSSSSSGSVEDRKSVV